MEVISNWNLHEQRGQVKQYGGYLVHNQLFLSLGVVPDLVI